MIGNYITSEIKSTLNIKSTEDVAYILGSNYRLLELSKDTLTLFGNKVVLDKIKTVMAPKIAYTVKDGITIKDKRIIDSVSKMVKGPSFISSFQVNSSLFTKHFIIGYVYNNLYRLELPNNKVLHYLKGKKRILKAVCARYNISKKNIFIYNSEAILYIGDNELSSLQVFSNCSYDEIVEFNRLFNLTYKGGYKAIIGLFFGKAILEGKTIVKCEYDLPQWDYVKLLESLFEFWDYKVTITKKDKYYIRCVIPSSSYFNNRIKPKKQVNKYLTRRINELGILLWYKEVGSNALLKMEYFNKNSIMLLSLFLYERYKIKCDRLDGGLQIPYNDYLTVIQAYIKYIPLSSNIEMKIYKCF